MFAVQPTDFMTMTRDIIVIGVIISSSNSSISSSRSRGTVHSRYLEVEGTL